jgi:lysine biosynthesis protein LysW
MTLITLCPLCDEEMDLNDDVELSEVVKCQNCENDLEVVSLEPLLLAEWDEEEK